MCEILGFESQKGVDMLAVMRSHGLTQDFDRKVVVPEGCVFVMGDNRNHSTDSRRDTIGFVDERTVLGKVLIRLNPFTVYFD